VLWAAMLTKMNMYVFLILSAIPANNPGVWVGTNDYPATALAARAEGTTSVQLDIAQDGTPVKCNVAKSSGHASLDEASCELLMKRAQFRPSTTNTEQSFATNIQWKIAPEQLTPVSFMGFTATSQVRNSVVQSDCIEKKIGEPDEEIALCELFSSDVFTDAIDTLPLADASLLHARFIFGPASEQLGSSLSTAAKTYTFMEASFDVNQAGVGTNCKIVKNQIGPNANEFCNIVSAEQAFDVTKVTSFPLQMTFLIDVTVE
jgi:TonB family protein